MPWYTGDDYARILHFGFGDIAITYGQVEDRPFEDCLVFLQHEPGEVGRETAGVPGQTTADDNVDCPVRMIFESVASLDVVIREMHKLRAQMVRDAPQKKETPPTKSDGKGQAPVILFQLR